MPEFNYPDMTPELRAYLDHTDRPSAIYEKKEDGASDYLKETAESKTARQAWRDEHSKLRRALPAGLLEAYSKARKVWLCRDETQQGDVKRFDSPCGKYHFLLTTHYTGPGTWSYSKARVYDAEGGLITTVCRNYGSFPFAWISKHANGHAYLLCGENYQGQTVIELDTGKRVDSLPAAASQGAGFCWASVHPSEDGTLLAVSGCYWAAPYEVIIVDFADPMSLPRLVLARDEDEHFAGWSDNNTCQIGRRWEAVDLPGHPLDGKSEISCSIEELEQVEKEAKDRGLPDGDCEAVWKEMFETHTWTRLTNAEQIQEWFRENVMWRIRRDKTYHRLFIDHVGELDLLWNRLTDDEQKALIADEVQGPLLLLAREWLAKAQLED